MLFLTEMVVGPEHGLPRAVSRPQSAGVQEAFGQRAQTQGLNLGWSRPEPGDPSGEALPCLGSGHGTARGLGSDAPAVTGAGRGRPGCGAGRSASGCAAAWGGVGRRGAGAQSTGTDTGTARSAAPRRLRSARCVWGRLFAFFLFLFFFFFFLIAQDWKREPRS